ncbi:class F sortase [Actinoplanes sp. NPDC049596]|uniref:class F sortase n=1 Tax=unclassified Actinoplanes TaxID=2626549 RepID=UPI00343CF585
MPASTRVAGLAVALAVALVWGPQAEGSPQTGSGPRTAGSAQIGGGPDGGGQSAPSGAPADAFVSSDRYATTALPVRLRIPALRVDSRLIDLGLQSDGSVQVPADAAVPGWYSGGPRPGQAGPAVILGHVDSKRGPGVFFALYRIKPGTRVEVDRADGTTAAFRITEVSRVAKTRFPTDLVYGPTLSPALRLVTCGGTFDHTRGSYRDNIIAFAEAA